MQNKMIVQNHLTHVTFNKDGNCLVGVASFLPVMQSVDQAGKRNYSGHRNIEILRHVVEGDVLFVRTLIHNLSMKGTIHIVTTKKSYLLAVNGAGKEVGQVLAPSEGYGMDNDTRLHLIYKDWIMVFRNDQSDVNLDSVNGSWNKDSGWASNPKFKAGDVIEMSMGALRTIVHEPIAGAIPFRVTLQFRNGYLALDQSNKWRTFTHEALKEGKALRFNCVDSDDKELLIGDFNPDIGDLYFGPTMSESISILNSLFEPKVEVS